jgi:hypothetical protein
MLLLPAASSHEITHTKAANSKATPMRCSVLAPALLLANLVGIAEPHASLISPLPRNAVDRFLPGYRGGGFGNSSCPHPGPEPPAGLPRNQYGPPLGDGSCWGCNCVNGSEPCQVAQTCVWFTEGTSIGCAEPRGDSPSPSPHCDTTMKATNNDPKYRTMNLNVTALSKEDATRFNPWRAPGNAPLYDPCGMAGGAPKWVQTALSFYDTVHAKQGDLGSKVLPRNPTGVVWKAGATVETKWNVRANHGGGYQYRLCPLSSSSVTEECFQRRPIPFSGALALEWQNGSRLEIEGRYLSTGTIPRGSMWARNPIPYSNAHTKPEFEPPCDEKDGAWRTETGVCSGRYLTNVSIVDWLTVPKETPAGDYVLQLRYDCEETAQVWTQCADISVV